ncbi:hypothetical protein HY989_05875 [Candidatus Micrarchaeota archaeon]|nr:hypothetical protein [Candidatus Micrarchaeota archaeon]
MNEEHMDSLIAFIIREKRYLKKRETSFTEKELKEGEDLLKRFIKAVQSRKLTDEQLKALETNPLKAKKLLKEIVPKVKAFNKKQLVILIQNYTLIHSVIEKKHKEHKIFVETLKADRFYNPKRKVY